MNIQKYTLWQISLNKINEYDFLVSDNNKVQDFGGVRPFTVNSWIEDNSSKLIGLENETSASER